MTTDRTRTARPHARPRTWLTLLALCALATWQMGWAQDCRVEAEPNDAPAAANAIGDQRCFVGELDGDDQDAFVWDVSEQDAGTFWVVEIEGIRNQLTRIDLLDIAFAEDGEGVTEANELWTFATPDGRPNASAPLLLPPGPLYMGISKSGGSGSYVVTLRPQRTLDRDHDALRHGLEVDGAFAVHGGVPGEDAGESEPTELAWTLDEDDASYLWDVHADVSIGDALDLEIVGPDGTLLDTALAPGGTRRTNLGVEAGTYQVRVHGEAGMMALSLVRGGRVTSGREVEPNDGFDQANLLPLGEPVEGELEGDDVFTFTVPQDAEERAYDLVIDIDAEADVSLHDEERTLQERRGAGGRLRDLVLEPGRYYVWLDGGGNAPYRLQLEQTELPGAGSEREPNDVLAAASPMADDLTARGTLHSQDVDVYRFEVGGEPQLWRVQTVGEGVGRLTIYNEGGIQQRSLDGERRLRLDDVRLLPGTTYLEVSRAEGDYALRALALGPAPEPEPEEMPEEDAELESAPARDAADDEEAPDDADAAAAVSEEDLDDTPLPSPPPGRLEVEPNDDTSRSERLRAGEVRVGTHGHDRDDDLYRFFLANDQYVRIEAVPPEGGQVRFDVGSKRAAPVREGGPAVFEGWLRAGDHFVETWSDTQVRGYYQLRLRLLDPIAVPVDQEPNDDPEQAAQVPASLTWQGTVGATAGNDYYRLPRFDQPAEMRIEGNVPEGVNLDVSTDDGRQGVDLNEEDGGRVSLPADGEATLRVRGTGSYRLSLSFDPPAPRSQLRDDPGTGAAELTFAEPAREVAAYWHEGQRVESDLTVRNTTDEEVAFRLEAHASDAAAEVDVPAEVAVPAGASADVPVAVQLPVDRRDDQPIQVSVATHGAGSVDAATLRLHPRCEAPPVGSAPHWRVPDPLLGGLNMLSPGFGAVPQVEDPGDVAALFDGRTAPSTGVRRAPDAPITVALAGDEPVELLGTLLHPQTRGGVSEQLHRFRIETSMDGETFTTVLEDRLQAARIEQAFAFDQPVRARYARLTFLDAHGDRTARLGEWKLVAAPERDVGRLDLTRPELGGSVTWSRPILRHPGELLQEEPLRARNMDMRDHQELRFVVGFHHQRAAALDEIAWVVPPEAEAEEVPPEVIVEVSPYGPTGPWEEVGRLAPSSPGETASLALDPPAWARYVQFRVPKIEDVRNLALPGKIRAFERPVGDDYRSITGEWGHYRREAAFEWSQPQSAEAGPASDDAGDTMDDATPLRGGAFAEGSVQVAEDVDWYRLELGAEENAVEIRLRGDPTIAFEYELMDAAGETVYYDLREEGLDTVLTAFADPGSELFLRLQEPKRSVVFSWDTSGSVSPYLPITYNSLAGFARDVDPSREFVQLLAFDNPEPIWLLPYWSSDRERVQRGIQTFDRDADSSNAEQALLWAARALEDREGTKAVLFMTDAESTGYRLTGELWEALEAADPRVFTFEISTSGSDYSQDLMQSWASVNQGYYDYARNVADFEVGFSRASCILRRAKRYEVEVATRFQEPPGPGALSVARGGQADLPGIEVIFDASGSMGAPLPSGESKIDVGKRVLRDLVGEILPEGTPFALRAFGHITPQSCESRLDVPLGPLDREAALSAIDEIQPKLLSQTPIADALSQVGSDLADAGAGRSVILITDGEESCGGDPEAALAELRDAGVDVQLSIVSLGIDEEEVRTSFAELAQSAGGSYAPADDLDSLRGAVTEALNPPYEVLDASGEVVAQGRIDGKAIEVPMGVYTVRVPGSPPQLIRDVRVPGDGSRTVTLPSP
ncbi:MAG: VWA domain-containing protein [Trueperaceae bacterium]|nr:VWA domain-containing protein [Trueperaceae bacterium]